MRSGKARGSPRGGFTRNPSQPREGPPALCMAQGRAGAGRRGRRCKPDPQLSIKPGTCPPTMHGQRGGWVSAPGWPQEEAQATATQEPRGDRAGPQLGPQNRWSDSTPLSSRCDPDSAPNPDTCLFSGNLQQDLQLPGCGASQVPGLTPDPLHPALRSPILHCVGGQQMDRSEADRRKMDRWTRDGCGMGGAGMMDEETMDGKRVGGWTDDGQRGEWVGGQTDGWMMCRWWVDRWLDGRWAGGYDPPSHTSDARSGGPRKD